VGNQALDFAYNLNDKGTAAANEESSKWSYDQQGMH
jgi:hypothetical protein